MPSPAAVAAAQAQLTQNQFNAARAKQAAQAANNPSNVYTPELSMNEFRAGVNPVSYTGSTNQQTGQLLDQYKMNPYAGEAEQALKQQAFSTGESPWAQMQTQLLGSQTQEARDAAARQSGQAGAEAQAQLSRFGGMGGGARTSLARSGARDLMNSQQGIARNAMNQRLGIGAQDIQRKQDLLGQFANAENAAQGANVNELNNELNRRAGFDVNRYNAQMQAWGAGQSADAQRAAASKGKK